jgi:hypothetical protein
MDATTCPECGAPAEVTDRFALAGTDGPMEHLKVICVRRHWFLMSTRSLAAARRVPEPRPAPAEESPVSRSARTRR